MKFLHSGFLVIGANQSHVESCCFCWGVLVFKLSCENACIMFFANE